jgi:hypothetical protein
MIIENNNQENILVPRYRYVNYRMMLVSILSIIVVILYLIISPFLTKYYN